MIIIIVVVVAFVAHCFAEYPVPPSTADALTAHSFAAPAAPVTPVPPMAYAFAEYSVAATSPVISDAHWLDSVALAEALLACVVAVPALVLTSPATVLT